MWLAPATAVSLQRLHEELWKAPLNLLALHLKSAIVLPVFGPASSGLPGKPESGPAQKRHTPELLVVRRG